MKDFTDFINYFNLDCQHLVYGSVESLCKSIGDDESVRSAKLPQSTLNAISSIATQVNFKYTMLMLECYHRWLQDS